jgi:hypothetical protein
MSTDSTEARQFRFAVTDADYEAIRANPRRFFVLPDHVFPEAEEVVGQEEGYVIVEKVGAAGRVAEASAT